MGEHSGVDARQQFASEGIVRVAGAFPVSVADLASALIWDVFDRDFGIKRDDPRTWNHVFQKRALAGVGGSPLFDEMLTDDLAEAIDGVFAGADWNWPSGWGDFLITFPNTTHWALPHRGWHQDYDFSIDCDPIRFCKAFIFLSDVGPGGGGTVVVPGSHRLRGKYDLGRATDADDRIVKGSSKLYEQCHWLHDLTTPGDAAHRHDRFMTTVENVDGIPLRVVELTGHPGDVVLIHPWTIHAVAPNAAHAPRFMRAPVFATKDGDQN